MLVGGAESMHTRWRARRGAARRAHLGDRRRPALRVGDRRRHARRERIRDRAPGGRAARWSTRCSRPRCAPRSATASTSTNAHVSELWSRLRRGRGREPARVVAYRVLARRDPHDLAPTTAWCASRTRSACAPTSTSTRARRCCCARTKRREPPAYPTTEWCSCTRPPKRTTIGSSPNAWSLAESPAIAATGPAALAAAGATHRRHRAHRPLLVLPFGRADRA